MMIGSRVRDTACSSIQPLCNGAMASLMLYRHAFTSPRYPESTKPFELASQSGALGIDNLGISSQGKAAVVPGGLSLARISSPAISSRLAGMGQSRAIFKPRLKSKKVANLYFAGQLTTPGPGVPPSLISGEVVCGEIVKDYSLKKAV